MRDMGLVLAILTCFCGGYLLEKRLDAIELKLNIQEALKWPNLL